MPSKSQRSGLAERLRDALSAHGYDEPKSQGDAVAEALGMDFDEALAIVDGSDMPDAHQLEALVQNMPWLNVSPAFLFWGIDHDDTELAREDGASPWSWAMWFVKESARRLEAQGHETTDQAEYRVAMRLVKLQRNKARPMPAATDRMMLEELRRANDDGENKPPPTVPPPTTVDRPRTV